MVISTSMQLVVCHFKILLYHLGTGNGSNINYLALVSEVFLTNQVSDRGSNASAVFIICVFIPAT